MGDGPFGSHSAGHCLLRFTVLVEGYLELRFPTKLHTKPNQTQTGPQRDSHLRGRSRFSLEVVHTHPGLRQPDSAVEDLEPTHITRSQAQDPKEVPTCLTKTSLVAPVLTCPHMWPW